ncbi:MAG TPA: DUF131 domain-containing protein [Nitrososphaerales archaeon]|nr:DUF131 domain-containing protein [Nitrososphaerales archaeon]
MVDLTLAGMVLALVGVGVMIASIASRGSEPGSGVKGAGVVMIGPIPIIFGSDAKWASIAMVLAIILVVISLVVWAI